MAQCANISEHRLMDWFEKLTGFQEADYDDTRAKLKVEGKRLRSLVNDKDYGVGELELVSLESLRQRVKAAGELPGRLRVRVVTGDVRQMHRLPRNAGALFQVASQFNLLEMISPDVTPEQGITRYQHDRTQGPACAIAAGAATIYRNYFVPINGSYGQNAERQLDGLVYLGAWLSKALGQPVGALWDMRNGYALCTRAGLDGIDEYVRSVSCDQMEMLRGMLRIGLHHDVEVTDTEQKDPSQHVSQAFCSALPVAYGQAPKDHWKTYDDMVGGLECPTRCLKHCFAHGLGRRSIRKRRGLDHRRSAASPTISVSICHRRETCKLRNPI
jgi:hypothetical protein